MKNSVNPSLGGVPLASVFSRKFLHERRGMMRLRIAHFNALPAASEEEDEEEEG
jgi:hypothetical protein